MKFKGQNIIFNKVFSKMSLFQDMDLGEMGPDFQSTVYFFSGCWLIIQNIKLKKKVEIVLVLNICVW